jgi:hypothetical protein
MNKKRNWAIAIVVTVTAGVFSLQSVSAPSLQELPQPSTAIPTVTHTPTLTYESCGYMWAYHDDMELSARINEAVQDVEPSASARVQLFGEDCVYADGHSTFSAMETDFYVQLPVKSLTKEELHFERVGQVLDIIKSIPNEEIQGNKGFVEFTFIKSEDEKFVIRISPEDYLIDSAGPEPFIIPYTPPSLPTTIASSTPTFNP